jgi:uncharacterized protein with PIN domain
MTSTDSCILFAADAMLGKLSRKLRIFGFDTIYDPNIHDTELIKLSMSNGRIVLTSDRDLFVRCKRKKVKAILVNEKTEIENLVAIFDSIDIKKIEIQLIPTRCTLCNESLDLVDRRSVSKVLPEHVLACNQFVYRCKKCRKFYWKGSHVEQMSKFAKRVNMKLLHLINQC